MMQLKTFIDQKGTTCAYVELFGHENLVKALKAPLRALWTMERIIYDTPKKRFWYDEHLIKKGNKRQDVKISYTTKNVNVVLGTLKQREMIHEKEICIDRDAEFSYIIVSGTNGYVTVEQPEGDMQTFKLSNVKARYIEDGLSWLNGDTRPGKGWHVAVRGTIPIQFMLKPAQVQPCLSPFLDRKCMSLDMVWACWQIWTNDEMIDIMRGQDSCEGKLVGKWTSWRVVNAKEFIKNAAYVKRRDEYVRDCLAVLCLVLDILETNDVLLAILPGAYLPLNHQRDPKIAEQIGNALCIMDIHFHLALNFNAILEKKGRLMVLHNTSMLTQQSLIEQHVTRIMFSSLDALGTYVELIKKDDMRPVVMATGELKDRRSVGNGAILERGLSAFDERLAYLSPVAYRCMFSPQINPHITEKAKKVDVENFSPLKFDRKYIKDHTNQSSSIKASSSQSSQRGNRSSSSSSSTKPTSTPRLSSSPSSPSSSP